MREAIEVVIGTIEGLLVFFLLFPGFFVERLLEHLRPHQQKDVFQKLTNAVFYTFVLYFFYRVIRLLLIAFPPYPIALKEMPFQVLTDAPYLEIYGLELAVVLFTVLALSILVEPIKMGFFRVMKAIRATNQTGSLDAYEDAFKLIEAGKYSKVAQIKLTDGTVLRGWIRCWSTPPSPPQFLISAEENAPLSITKGGKGNSEELCNDAVLLLKTDNIEWLRIEDVLPSSMATQKKKAWYSVPMERFQTNFKRAGGGGKSGKKPVGGRKKSGKKTSKESRGSGGGKGTDRGGGKGK